jgi:hypothetical protein
MALNVAERTVKLTMVTSGMIIRIQYKTGLYNIFVVNPNRRNLQTGTFQLHGYKLGATVTESDFINILVNLNAGIIIDSVNSEILTTEITDTAAYEARYILRGVDERPYRTFNIEDIISVTRLSIEIPNVIDLLVRGQIVVTNKSSKRQLLTCAQLNDDECLKNIPEIRERILPERTKEEIAREEATEREDSGGATRKIRDISVKRIFNDSE